MIDINDEFTLQHKRIYADKNKKKCIKCIKKIKKKDEFIIIQYNIILKLSDLCI